jgi:hypothetical protein
MNLRELYSASISLRKSTQEVADRLEEEIGMGLQFVEYITLPDIGQRVILRFELPRGRITSLADADHIETRMRACAGVDYWVNLVNNYAQIEPEALIELLEDIDRSLPDDIVRFSPTRHSQLLKGDADLVREALNLPSEYLVWEIEVPASPGLYQPVLRVIDVSESGQGLASKPRPKGVEIGNVVYQVEYFKNNRSFRGCVKAYLAAQAGQKTMTSVITRLDPGKRSDVRPPASG